MILNIVEYIETILDDYHQEMGKRPGGIVLGPKEYLELCEYTKRVNPVMKDAMVGQTLITEYRGYPVYLKEMPGVDLIIDYTEVSKYI